MHDACARYVTLVEVDNQDRTVVHDFGGYWRLCPQPLELYGDLEAMRANLAAGALAEPLNAADGELMSAGAHLLSHHMIEQLLKLRLSRFKK